MIGTPPLQTLAEAALRVLAREGHKTEGEWHASVPLAGMRLDIRLAGPDLPSRLPAAIAPADLIARQRPWIGAYRLTVTAPLIVLDLYWNSDEPLRVMTFSRGDWEAALVTLTR